MPPLTRWLLRTAIAYLLLAMIAGLALAVPSLVPAALRAGLLPVYFHLLMVGWVTQLIFGVAWWMFPRPAPARSFGNPLLGWSAYALLNAGLLLRALCEPLLAHASWPAASRGLVVAAALQLLGVVAFASVIWRRVRGT